MDRRRFLTIGSVSAAALAAAGGWSWTPAPLKSEVWACPALRSMLDGVASIDALGRRYRAARPEENSRAALIRVLHTGLDPGAALTRGRLDERIRADFAQGRTVQLDGWIVSVTEARQCALYSLRHVRGRS